MKRLLLSLGSQAEWTARSFFGAHGCFVLAYHRIGTNQHQFKSVPAEVFRSQMRSLREHCTPLSPGELRDHAFAPRAAKPAVLVTFDDGYRDYLEVAYPILQEFGIPAVNFVATHFVDTGDTFWWDAIDLAVARTPRTRLTLPWDHSTTVTLDDDGRRWLRLEARRHVKRGPDADRENRLDSLLDALDVRREGLGCERQVMTWSEIRAVRELTTIGAHTHSHPLLSRLDPSCLDHEIRECRDRIKMETGEAPTLFAYPSGHVTAAAKDALRDHGFDAAFSTQPGLVGRDTDWLQVPRMYVSSAAGCPVNYLRFRRFSAATHS